MASSHPWERRTVELSPIPIGVDDASLEAFIRHHRLRLAEYVDQYNRHRSHLARAGTTERETRCHAAMRLRATARQPMR